MEISELKSQLIPFLRYWIVTLSTDIKKQGKKYNDDVGFGNYVLINRLKNHYSIEILGFQKITDKPNFIFEDKPNNSDLNFFINGGKNFDDYNGLKAIMDGTNVINNDSFCSISNLLMSVVKTENVIDVLFDEVTSFKSAIFKEDCDLPFYFPMEATNIFLHNIAIVSKVGETYSFRRHSTTMIIRKNITVTEFQIFLKNIFDGINEIPNQAPPGVKLKYQIISELKSLAYHKVDETSIDKFIQIIADDFAIALGYISARSNVRLEIQENLANSTDKKYLTPDFLMEKKDGTFDILDLKIGLLTADFAFGDWTNSYFSSYAQKLLGQLAGYKRYFSNKENADWTYAKYGIKVKQPKLIGIAGNHNNFNRQIVDTALEGNIDDFNLISYNDLTELLK